jgi:hypothetical protein
MKPIADIARIVIFITGAADLARARTAPLGRCAGADAEWDRFGQPEPDFEFDQRVGWWPPSSAGELQPLPCFVGPPSASIAFQRSATRTPCAKEAAERPDGALTARRSPHSLLA